MPPSRRLRWVAISLAVVLVAALHPSLASAAEEPEPGGADAADSPADTSAADDSDPLSVLIRPVTGVRPGATTVVGGALINQGDSPAPVRLQLAGLPDGVSIDAVRPDVAAPADGRRWSCDATTCRLVDTAGAEQSLAADADIGLVLALRGELPASGATVEVTVGDRPAMKVPLDRQDGAPPMATETLSMSVTGASTAGAEQSLAADADIGLVLALRGELPASGATVEVTVGDRPAMKVPLDRQDGAPPMATETLSMSVTGASSVLIGDTVETTLRVSNLGSAPTAPGSIALTRSGPVALGLAVTAAGDGWTCDVFGNCTSSATLGPLDSTPPLVITTSAGDWASDGADATLTFRSTAATAAAPQLTAEATAPLTVVAPSSHGVSARVGPLTSASVSAPATQTVPLWITPTGRGDLAEPVEVTLETTKGISVDWSAATSDGPWECTSDTGCRSTGVLVGATPSRIDVPVTVSTGTAPGVHDIEVVATVSGGETDRATAGLTVVPPPAPELRASMRSAADAAAPTDALSGAALQFAPHEPRDVVLTVTNLGTRPAPAGSEVDVEAWPDVAQRVEQVGDDRWTCSRPGEATRDRRVRCTHRLTEDLASNASLDLPIRLGPTGTGRSTWTLRSGLDGHRPADGARRYRIEVGERLARMVAEARVVHELVDGGVGSIDVTLTNRGAARAAGSVLLVEIPPGVTPATMKGDGWTCVDTALRGTRGNVRCTNPDPVAPGAAAPVLRMDLDAATDARQVELWMWATAPGQIHRRGPRAGTTVTLDVRRAPAVHPGDDLTVVTPVLGPDGVRRPAVVVLQGRAHPSLRSQVEWTQRCTVAGERDCDGVTPAVTWSDVEPGTNPTTTTARFTAPSQVTEPMTLHFRFRAGDGRNTHHEDVTVHLVPARTEGSDTADTARRGARSGDTGRSRTAPGGSGGTAPAAAVPVDVEVGDGTTLQVATRTGAVLTSTASGAAPLTYRWTQTSGPTAKVLGGTDAPNLSFTAPDLHPDQTSDQLTWRLTVTGADGTTASADAQVQVVWGDDGLEVALGNGAPSVVGTIDGPVVVTSTVTSAGAPYRYDWSLGDGDVTLPDGTATNRSTLSFTAPDQPGSTTAQLRVTDSFGRVTDAEIDLDITELPAGMVPAALCRSLSDLQAGNSTTLGGTAAGVSVTIPAGQVDAPTSPTTTTTTTPTTVAPSTSSSSTTTTTASPSTTTGGGSSSVPSTDPSTAPTTTDPASTSTTQPVPSTTTTTVPSCAATATATFTGATMQLPGGVVLTDARGRLSITGVMISSATVNVPGNWGPTALSVPKSGVLAPFVSSTDLGLPLGSLTGASVPFGAPPGWTGATTVTFSATDAPHAVIAAQAAPATGTGSFTLSGTLVDSGATELTLRSTGLIGLGTVDVPLAGTISTPDAAAAPVYDVSGAVEQVTPLSTDVALQSLTVAWTPTVAAGRVALTIGAGSDPLVLSGAATFSGHDAQLGFAAGESMWTPAGPNGPGLDLTGTGSMTGGTLTLNATAAPVPTWAAAHSLVVSQLGATVTASCAPRPSTACGPDVALSAQVDASPVAAAGAPVAATGTLDLSTGVTSLTAPLGDLSIAPLTVLAATLTVDMDPTDGATARAAGTSQVLGATRPTQVTFGADAAVAVATLDDLQPVPGWTLAGTVALATDMATTFDLPGGGAEAAVALTPGSLVGAATTTMPVALSDGLLPSEVTSGVLTFPIGDTTPTQFDLQVGAPQGWYLAGSSTSATSVSVDRIEYQLVVDGTTTTVDVTAAGTLTLGQLPGGGTSAPESMTASGTLSHQDGAGALNLTFASAPGTTWAGPGGVAGMSIASLSLQASATPSATTVSLTGQALLPAGLSVPLGITAGAMPSISGSLTAEDPCLDVDLGTGGASGIDPASSGLLATDTASLVLAPEGCTVAGVDLPAGLTLHFDSALGGATIEIDPGALSAAHNLDAGQAHIGGLGLSDTTVDIELADGVATLDVAGTVTLDGVDLPLAGTVGSSGGPVGQLTLTGDTDTLAVTDGLTVDDADVGATVASLPGPGTPKIAVTGNADLLGSSVVVTLAGSSSGTEITQLSGTAPSTTYALATGDSLTTDLLIDYDSAATTPLQITSGAGNATLTTPTRTFGAGTLVLHRDTFDLSASIALPGSLGIPAAVDGDYTLTDGATDTAARGDYSFTNPSSTELTLAGFDASGLATFERSGADEETATLSATLSLGLFDTDTPVVVEGPIAADGTATLTGTQQDVELRGLTGDATLTISPGTGTLGAQGWYDAAIDLRTRPGDCAMWSGAPDLTGDVYRSGDTTSYTLTGTTQINLPAGLDIVAAGQATQPLVLSNEDLESPDQPADGITLALGLQSEAFTATGSVSFAVAQCSFSVNGFLSLTFGGGGLAQSLAGSFAPVPPVQEQVGDLFGGQGELPANIVTVREAMEAGALSAAHAAAVTRARARLAAAQSDLDSAKDDVETATANAAAVRQQLEAAQQELEAALARAAAEPDPGPAPIDPSGGGDGAGGDSGAGGDDDPQQQVQVATAAAAAAGAANSEAQLDVERAMAQADEATGNAGLAQALSSEAADAAAAASQAATDATDALTEAVDAQQSESDEKTLQVTFSYTHCTTCDPTSTFTIDGEMTFEIIYVAGLDLSLGWGDGGLQSIEGTVSLGIEKQFTAGWSHFNVYAEADATVSLTLGYDVDQGWVKASAELDMHGKLQVNVHLWIVSFSATLASVSISAQMNFLPSPVTVAGSASIHVLGFGGSVHFGPSRL